MSVRCTEGEMHRERHIRKGGIPYVPAQLKLLRIFSVAESAEKANELFNHFAALFTHNSAVGKACFVSLREGQGRETSLKYLSPLEKQRVSCYNKLRASVIGMDHCCTLIILESTL